MKHSQKQRPKISRFSFLLGIADGMIMRTCHWCHVMEQESFEDEEIAKILNQHFISIKVDREIRPDIDSIYMSVCQAMTGSGGWPMSIFMTPAQAPFYAGTYFPKTSRSFHGQSVHDQSAHGQTGFMELLIIISRKWKEDREQLLTSADTIMEFISKEKREGKSTQKDLLQEAFDMFCRSFDQRNGGFGNAPKFPSAHNLLYLMDYYEQFSAPEALHMAETTLAQMYKGGLFDHIGGGFSRYSTDAWYLVPHFEKMLYDNALLMMAYARAFHITGKDLYQAAAEKTAVYILREMTGSEGGFYSAQDADSEGVEGKYYTFTREEILQILGESEGENFCRFFDISRQGNFEKKNIPNLLHHDSEELSYENEDSISRLYDFRKTRTELILDDKMLTSWNSLMIGAFVFLYRVFGKEKYLTAAMRAETFIEEFLMDGDTVYVGYRKGSRLVKGFLDDYAFYIHALLQLYDAALDNGYLSKAKKLTKKAIKDFFDYDNGGFYLYGKDNEQLILRPKETYDGALPSGNSVMSYNLVRLSVLRPDDKLLQIMKKQISYMNAQTGDYPIGSSFYLTAFMQYQITPEQVICVLKNPDDLDKIKGKPSFSANIIILQEPTEQYPLVNNRTTYYICRNYSCLPPVNEYE